MAIEEEIMGRLPKLAAVIGEAWLRKKRCWTETSIMPRLPWYEQVERDFTILGRHVVLQKLIACYRASLRNQPQTQKAIFEIHGAALLANAATRVDLHVPVRPGSRSNFDVWAEIRGHHVNAESKTRKDEFPYNMPPKSEDPAGITLYGGSRATMDPHDAVDLGIDSRGQTVDPHHIDTPESTVIRQLLLDGISQLPDQGYNVIIFGHIDGDRYDLEEALYGTKVLSVLRYRRGLETGKPTGIWTRVPTGAFSPDGAGELFQRLSGVLWVRLWRDGNVLGRAYKLYSNPNARLYLPSDVIEALETRMKQWATPDENQVPATEG